MHTVVFSVSARSLDSGSMPTEGICQTINLFTEKCKDHINCKVIIDFCLITEFLSCRNKYNSNSFLNTKDIGVLHAMASRFPDKFGANLEDSF